MRFKSAVSIGLMLLTLLLLCIRAVREQAYLFIPWIILCIASVAMLVETVLYALRTSRLRREGKTQIAEITRVHYGPDLHLGAGLGGRRASSSDVWAMQTISFQLKGEEGLIYTTPLLIFTGSQELRISVGRSSRSEISIRKRIGRKARIFVNPNDPTDYFVDPHSL